jgi:putative ATP-dependent endonuclease of the OLD family
MMRLGLFSVKNFRSITNAEKLPLGDFTVLVGPNNEGKSNILEALALGMQELSNPTTRPRYVAGPRRYRPGYERNEDLIYNWERDFPQTLQSNGDGRTSLNFDFELTPEEVDEFYKEVGSRFNDSLPISLTFGRTGSPSFRVRKQGKAQQLLSTKRLEIAKFVSSRVQVQYVPAVRTGDRVTRIVKRMLTKELAAVATDPEYAKALSEVQRLQEPVLDKLAAAITARLQALLPDVRSVQFDQEADRTMARGLVVILDDGTATDLSLKGDGVQSLAALAMMQHYSRENARAREFILAVEEPEAHLHPSAIHALRDTLRETSETQQVVVTTHSPLFVNRLELAGNIIVTKNRAAPATSVQELRDVLGVQVADNLEGAEVVLVVEGLDDERALRAVLSDRSERLARALVDGIVGIAPLAGAGKIKYVLVQLRDSLAAVHAFLDDDSAGREAAASSEGAGLLSGADITMTICLGAKESEFEDMVQPAIYTDAFEDEFGVVLGAGPKTKGKWSSRMAVQFRASGKPWSDRVEMRAKEIVADAVSREPGNAIREICDGVIGALVAGLERKLDTRRH